MMKLSTTNYLLVLLLLININVWCWKQINHRKSRCFSLGVANSEQIVVPSLSLWWRCIYSIVGLGWAIAEEIEVLSISLSDVMMKLSTVNYLLNCSFATQHQFEPHCIVHDLEKPELEGVICVIFRWYSNLMIVVLDQRYFNHQSMLRAQNGALRLFILMMIDDLRRWSNTLSNPWSHIVSELNQ